MLKEARIILPFAGSARFMEAHRFLADYLTDKFGGYTVSSGRGAWRAPNKIVVRDDVEIYDVAVPGERDASWDHLAVAAQTAGWRCGQQCVYLRYPDGSVEFVDCADAAEKGNGDAPSFDKPHRLPKPGEVWKTRTGALALVRKPMSTTLVGPSLACMTIKQGAEAVAIGYGYSVFADTGHVLSSAPSALDLVQYVDSIKGY